MTENLPAISVNKMVPSEHEMTVYNTMAKHAVATNMYKNIGNETGLMMIMLSAREIGIPPMQALNGGINIINGKVEISARMMSALIRKSGHSLSVKSLSDTECTIVGKRCDNGDTGVASFTIQEAQKAGLIRQGGGWTKFPKDMLYARALSRLARQLFSDVIGMGYVEGEIKAVEQETECEEIVVQEEYQLKYFVDNYLKDFDREEQMVWIHYLDVVSHHFGWSTHETIKQLTENFEETKRKFQVWKSKQKENDE